MMSDFPESWIAEVHERPLCRYLQIQLRHHKQGAASARMRLGPHVAEDDGVVSEGALTTLGGWTAQLAILSLVGQGRAIVPLEHRISLLQPARSGEVIAKARVEHMRARLAHCSYRIVDQDGELVAVGGFLADVLPREQVTSPREQFARDTVSQTEDAAWAEDGDASSLDISSVAGERERKDTYEIPKVVARKSPTLDGDATLHLADASMVHDEPTHADLSRLRDHALNKTLERSSPLSSRPVEAGLPDLEEDDDSLDETVLSSVEAFTKSASSGHKLSSSRVPTLEWSAPNNPNASHSASSLRQTGAYGALEEDDLPSISTHEAEDTEKFVRPLSVSEDYNPLDDHQDTGEFDAPQHQDTDKFVLGFVAEDTEQFPRSGSPDDTQKMVVEEKPLETERQPPPAWLQDELGRLPKKSISRPLRDHTMISRVETTRPKEPPASLPIEADFFDDDPKLPGKR